jgi:hypothetical protein
LTDLRGSRTKKNRGGVELPGDRDERHAMAIERFDELVEVWPASGSAGDGLRVDRNWQRPTRSSFYI